MGLLMMFLGCLQKKPYRLEFIIFSATTLIMIGGYSLVYVDGRYLWLLLVFSVISGGLWLSLMQKTKMLSNAQIILGGLLICGIAALTSGQTIATSIDPTANLTHQQLAAAYSPIPPGAIIISDTFESFRACSYFNFHCYSVLAPPGPVSPGYRVLLIKLHINYYVDYHTRDTDVLFQQFVHDNFTQISEHVVSGKKVTVYNLN